MSGKVWALLRAGAIVAGGVGAAEFPRSLDDLYTLDGRQYGLPKDYDTVGLRSR
ncbi:hypothetical protein [Streptosporangium roseum]|uniref:hypothetical protein n=1 Tax=Streptosporangium roseum TaxID=2001 RepID=UPI00332166F0